MISKFWKLTACQQGRPCSLACSPGRVKVASHCGESLQGLMCLSVVAVTFGVHCGEGREGAAAILGVSGPRRPPGGSIPGDCPARALGPALLSCDSAPYPFCVIPDFLRPSWPFATMPHRTRMRTSLGPRSSGLSAGCGKET